MAAFDIKRVALTVEDGVCRLMATPSARMLWSGSSESFTTVANEVMNTTEMMLSDKLVDRRPAMPKTELLTSMVFDDSLLFADPEGMYVGPDGLTIACLPGGLGAAVKFLPKGETPATLLLTEERELREFATLFLRFAFQLTQLPQGTKCSLIAA